MSQVVPASRQATTQSDGKKRIVHANLARRRLACLSKWLLHDPQGMANTSQLGLTFRFAHVALSMCLLNGPPSSQDGGNVICRQKLTKRLQQTRHFCLCFECCAECT